MPPGSLHKERKQRPKQTKSGLDAVFGWMTLIESATVRELSGFGNKPRSRAGLAFQVDEEGSKLELTPGTMRKRGDVQSLGHRL